MLRDYDSLARYLAERSAMPFAFGRHANDCVAFANGAIIAQGGQNRLGRHRWKSEVGAARIVKRGGGLTALVDAQLTRIAPAQAQRGDIAGIEGDYLGGIALAVITGQHLVGVAGVTFPREAMTMAWSAG